MVKLGDVATKIQDGTHFSPHSTSGPFRYLTSKNVRFGRLDITDCGWISEQEHRGIYARCDVRCGDVLLTKDGANTGNAALNFLNEPFSLLSSVAIIRTDDVTAHSPFILQYLLSPQGQQRLKDLMAGNAITRLTLKKIKDFTIPLPQVAHQQKIARILATLDNLIEKTESLIAKYQAIKQGMMHDLFTRGIDEHGHLRPPQTEASDLYKQSVLGWVPKEWEVRPTGDLAKYINGNSFNAAVWSKYGLPIIRIQNLNGEETYNYYDGSVDPNWEVLPGDLLFAWAGMLETSFGPRLWKGPRGVLNQHIFKVVPNSNLVRKKFLHLLLKHNLQRIVLSAHGFKSSFVHVTRAELFPVCVCLPTGDEQDRIVRILDKTDSLLERELQYVANLTKTKNGLMQDLLTGKVRVKVDEAEEVAVDA